jgi:predicted PurR-regulated permease PerM
MTDARPSPPVGEPVDAPRRGVQATVERFRERTTLTRLRPLVALVAIVLALTCLALARDVLIPFALASLIALVLTPLVAFVQRRGVHRIVAVVLVVLVVFSALGGVVWILAQQVTTLAADLPRYRHNIRQKIADIRGIQRGGSIEKVQDTVKDVVGEIQKNDRAAKAPPRTPVPVPVPAP